MMFLFLQIGIAALAVITGASDFSCGFTAGLAVAATVDFIAKALR